MDVAAVVAYCLAKPGAWADNPFRADNHVAKVGDRIFCFWADDPPVVVAKNTRSAVLEWRARYPEHVGGAAHLHKELWNRVLLTGRGAPGTAEVRELIDDSYEQVVALLPRAKRPSA